MEPSKANTVGTVNSPSLCTTRKTLQFFRACSGFFFFFHKMERIINQAIPLLLELPYLKIKPKTQTQQAKK